MMHLACSIIFVTFITIEDVNCNYLLIEIEDDSQTSPPISPMTTTMSAVQPTKMIRECNTNAQCKEGEVCIEFKCTPDARFSCTGKKCGDLCNRLGERDAGKCNDQGNCIPYPFEPTCQLVCTYDNDCPTETPLCRENSCYAPSKPEPKPEPVGKQCVPGKRTECPNDICNKGFCSKGCATGACTKVRCHVRTKRENDLCYIERNNCDEGLKCMKQDDGCNNGIGRCVKSGHKPRQHGQGGSYNNGYVEKYKNGQGESYSDPKQEERYNPWQAYH